MMVTINDVAKEANVSASTVSRVLNNTGTISQPTTNTVIRAVKKLGYEPNVLARNFRKKRTRTILILTPNMTNPFYSNIISGICDLSRDMNYSSFVCNTTDETQQIKKTLDMLYKHKADGAILLASEKGQHWLSEYAEEFPIIQCCEYDPDLDISRVSIDNYHAAVDTVRYLIALGHKKIGMISSVNKYLSTENRLKGYKDALREAGLESTDRYVAFAGKDYNYQSGCRAAEKLLTQSDRPTALFCISDVLAIGAVNTAKIMGMCIPEDISIVGFDDVEQTSMFTPKITTVAQPCYSLGQKATELLCRKLEQNESIPLETILPYRMIIRDSTGPRP